MIKYNRIKEGTMGIYGISNINTGEMYVGQAGHNGIGNRFSYHKTGIESGTHEYEEFNEAYKADENCIKFEVLDIVNDESLLGDLEDFYMNTYFDRVDGITVINKDKNRNNNHTVADTSNMKAAQTGERNGNCRLSVDEVKQIKFLLNNSDMMQDEIGLKYGVSQGHICNIASGVKWPSVREEQKPDWFVETK